MDTAVVGAGRAVAVGRPPDFGEQGGGLIASAAALAYLCAAFLPHVGQGNPCVGGGARRAPSAARAAASRLGSRAARKACVASPRFPWCFPWCWRTAAVLWTAGHAHWVTLTCSTVTAHVHWRPRRVPKR